MLNEYLLFIDTEASGLPKRWNEPYTKENNWPHSVQISWLIYTKDGVELKREDHYISDNDFNITPASIRIHGITRNLLNLKGTPRKGTLQLLHDDLIKYKPLVIGHFMELDYHVLAADFLRAGIPNPIADLKLPAFCTMMASTKFVRNPQSKYLKLGQLYDVLFNATLLNPHNAIVDAKATADCFFEMIKRGDLKDADITAQNLDLSIKPKSDNKHSWIFFSIVLFILIITLWI